VPARARPKHFRFHPRRGILESTPNRDYSGDAMSVGDPKRVRSSVRHRGRHIGYVTVATYPDRDLICFSAGSPYSEVVVSDLTEKHVALFQEFKEHWLVHCGPTYDTTNASGRLTGAQVMALAAFALLHRDQPAPVLVEALKTHVEVMLG
jgi:hypothetical protein